MANQPVRLWRGPDRYGRFGCLGCRAVRQRNEALPIAVDPYGLAQSA